MNFHEPTQANLQTLCGWALARQSVAEQAGKDRLQRFMEACEEIIPIAQEKEIIFERATPQEVPVRRSYRQPTPEEHEILRVLGERNNPAPAQVEVCHHKFNIDTQFCIFCGKSYREVKCRKAELMT